MSTKIRTLLTTILPLFIIILSIIGMIDAGYVTYEEFSGVIPVCGGGFDCGTVLDSKWAKIGPVPVSLFGIFFYITIFSLGILQYLAVPFPKSIRSFIKKFTKENLHFISKNAFLGKKFNWFFAELSWQKIAYMLSKFGFLFTIYLVSIMAFVLQAWCLYCLISAITTTFIFISLSTLTYLEFSSQSTKNQ